MNVLVTAWFLFQAYHLSFSVLSFQDLNRSCLIIYANIKITSFLNFKIITTTSFFSVYVCVGTALPWSSITIKYIIERFIGYLNLRRPVQTLIFNECYYL